MVLHNLFLLFLKTRKIGASWDASCKHPRSAFVRKRGLVTDMCVSQTAIRMTLGLYIRCQTTWQRSVTVPMLASMRVSPRDSLMQVWSSQPNAVCVSLGFFDKQSSADQNLLLKGAAMLFNKAESR